MTQVQRERITAYLEILKTEASLAETVQQLLKDSRMDFGETVYYTVFAPVLVCFVNWVLEEAEKKGIKRLYFLARDGYQMYLAAKALKIQDESGIECRYLYGSRQAWRVPLFFLEREQCLEKICLGGIDVTFEKVMKRGKLTEEEALAVAEELGFTGRYRNPLSYREIRQLIHPLKESRLFLNYVYIHSKEAYAATIGYLKQEGLLDETNYAIVDSGWTGSMQHTLLQLLRQEGFEKQLEGFYFGLYELPAKVPSGCYHSYFFGPQGGISRKVYFSNCLYEAVYSAPHGMTVGYEEKNGSFVPVFCKEENLNQRQMEQISEWLMRFLEQYHQVLKKSVQGFLEKRKTRDMVFRLLRTLMGTPVSEEVEAYGTLLFSDDVTEDYVQEVAAQLTTEELRNQRFLNKACIMLGLKKGELHDSAWPEGSVVRNGDAVKSGLRHAAIYKYVLYTRKAFRK